MNLKNKKYFVLDMDGTFYLGDNLLRGSTDFLDTVKNNGGEVLFFTNNSSKNSAVYEKKLAALGVLVPEDNIVTSGMVTVGFLKEHHKDARVYLMGTPLLEEDFTKRGINLVDSSPDVVVVGFDTTLDYEKLTICCDFIRDGAVFLCTHPDNNCPTATGFIPDCGAICAFITTATDVEPRYLGKPYPETIEYILNKLQCSKEELCFVGDRLSTDVAIGVNNGVTAVLVLSGATKEEEIAASDVKPDVVVEGLWQLNEMLK